MRLLDISLLNSQELQAIKEKYCYLHEFFRHPDEILQLFTHAEQLERNPNEFILFNFPFYYWEVIGNFGLDEHIIIPIGILSSGKIYTQDTRYIRRRFRSQKIFLIHPSILNFDFFYSILHGRFVAMDFLIQLEIHKLHHDTINEVLGNYDFYRHKSVANVFMEIYYRKIKIAIKRCLEHKNDLNFINLSLKGLIEKYVDVPDKRALELRNEIAEKYGFKYREKGRKFEIVKGENKIEIFLDNRPDGEVFINKRYICIEVPKKDLPVDDMIAAKMLSLAIPNLRNRISTIKLKDRKILDGIFVKK